ncbi:MAG: sulfotransferase domain-containing protein [Vicinamibacterales bacterium]
MSLATLIRRLRVGAPIVVVSGLPRSGTSMMMRMLEAGGVPIAVDGARKADVDNPRGYFELEAVKDLDKPGRPTPWLPAARGRAVKIISFLLTWLPEDYDYQVIFMDRDLDEVLASQQHMLERRGEAPVDAAREAAAVRATYESHLTQVRRFLGVRQCFSTLTVSYREAVADPAGTADRVATFLGRRLDTAAMAKAVEASLYRNRA